MILTNEIKEILENIVYWDSCPQDYKDKINDYLTSENEPKALNIDLVISYYKLIGGDIVKEGDEFLSIDKWVGVPNYSIGDIYSESYHKPMRRKI